METNIAHKTIPAQSVGVGLKPSHYRAALGLTNTDLASESTPSSFGFFEVHAENFMGSGGAPHAWLSAIRDKYPLSVHGVALSIGGMSRPDPAHLKRFCGVVERYQPALVSEHLAWCAHDGVFFNDLIAPPLTRDTLDRVCDHVDEIQSALGRRILIENPSQYLDLPSEMGEPDFLNAMADRTGCGLLLDVNNVYVSAHNLDFSAADYMARIDLQHVGEIHLAGHAIDEASGLRIDDHGSPVSSAVGELYIDVIRRAGPKPTLVEWDTDTPPLDELAAEAGKATRWMQAGISAAATLADPVVQV